MRKRPQQVVQDWGRTDSLQDLNVRGHYSSSALATSVQPAHSTVPLRRSCTSPRSRKKSARPALCGRGRGGGGEAFRDAPKLHSRTPPISPPFGCFFGSFSIWLPQGGVRERACRGKRPSGARRSGDRWGTWPGPLLGLAKEAFCFGSSEESTGWI